MKRFCPLNHDTEVVGRIQRMCRECKRMSYRRDAPRRRINDTIRRIRKRRVRVLEQIAQLAEELAEENQ